MAKRTSKNKGPYLWRGKGGSTRTGEHRQGGSEGLAEIATLGLYTTRHAGRKRR